jgi:hypothetical protein
MWVARLPGKNFSAGSARRTLETKGATMQIDNDVCDALRAYARAPHRATLDNLVCDLCDDYDADAITAALSTLAREITPTDPNQKHYWIHRGARPLAEMRGDYTERELARYRAALTSHRSFLSITHTEEPQQ